ncbi:MAG: tRNA uridine-5-carboxymethylaminomethyl(34) synthesis enzyme MnmG [Bacteroidales bacterium]|jgi:tRNA uridine 5-carboxymethylaminomethyl modification enzyme|nr:tRNA uridine-5-carboxymethylaminomethyl(34) synthesis enzyme MnmG [Bacteroidales bacterium]
MFKEFDIIVVGAGHAGCEAAYCCANLKENTLLITQNLSAIAQLSCNPAMGGVAKGQIVREIDALGGYSGINTDKNTMQFRMLNSSKGPAMWSPRAQVDDITFPLSWREKLENTENLSLWQDEVVGVMIENEKVCGVKTKLNLEIRAKAVVLTNGTFLSGRIHVGETNFVGGRLGETSAIGLTENLVSYGFVAEKLKTGTPMRVDGRTIDFNKLIEQKGDENPSQFSFLPQKKNKNIQRSCFLAYTNEQVHDILRTGFKYSPMFQGRIQGKGPRYCPSIEDKIERFSGKTRHQLFVEPESNYTNLYYINGFSSSLPLSVQYEALQHIVGFEHSVIERPGYAIEYDYFPPTQLQDTLETKLIKNLFFAGQINGTTGYEEAACQGLIAGINAHLKIKEKEPLVLKRSEAYIGVLIDDLITKGVDEPYRMFTSRAEYRILLRQDNADERLTPIGFKLGLASKQRMLQVEKKIKEEKKIIAFIKSSNAKPDEVNEDFVSKDIQPINHSTKISQLLLRPQVNINELIEDIPYLKTEVEKIPKTIRERVVFSAETKVKYESYIQKEQEIVDKMNKQEDLKIKDGFDYQSLQSLSFEAREKLSKIRPKTIGQASRISGVSPSDIAVLVLYISK